MNRMVRGALVGALRALKVERPVRAVANRCRPWYIRRNDLDDERLRLILAATLVSDSNVIDVGAHVGTIIDAVLEIAPKGTHIAFEPLPELYEELKSKYVTVEIHPYALSDKNGAVGFVKIVDEIALSGLKRTTDAKFQEIEVETRRLDDALPPGYIPDLIKIDVEGAEMLVIKGAMRTLEAHLPFLAFEHGRTAREHYGTDSGELFDVLIALGYSIIDMDGRRYDRRSFEAAERWNFFAVASTRVRTGGNKA